MDPIPTGAVVKLGEFGEKMADSAAKEAGGLLARLFGPSADVIGSNWAERLRERNLNKLLRKTEKRAKGKSDPGIANPRVASQTFEAAEYADAEVVSEYLSGVLASSRTLDGSSDRGVGWVALIKRLSSDDLRMHYVLYASAREALFRQKFTRLGEAHNIEVVLPLVELAAACDMAEPERISAAIHTLVREGLLGEAYRYGKPDFVFEAELKHPQNAVDYPDRVALRARLTIHGIELFLWGNGAGEMLGMAYLDPRVTLHPIDEEAQLPLVEVKTVKEVIARAGSETG